MVSNSSAFGERTFPALRAAAHAMVPFWNANAPRGYPNEELDGFGGHAGRREPGTLQPPLAFTPGCGGLSSRNSPVMAGATTGSERSVIWLGELLALDGQGERGGGVRSIRR